MKKVLTNIENFPQLSVSNKNLITFMVEKVSQKPEGKLNYGETSSFLREVSEESKVNYPTVSRIYYTYVKKIMDNNEIEVQEKNVEHVQNKSANEYKVVVKKVFYRNSIIPVYLKEGQYYLVLVDLLNSLPKSNKNEQLVNAFSVRARKQIIVNGKQELAVEVEKVKEFLKNFLNKLSEGKQKIELRQFLESMYGISKNDVTPNRNTEKPAQLVNKVSNKVAIKKENGEQVIQKVQKISDVQQVKKASPIKTFAEVKPVLNIKNSVEVTNEIDVNESEELRTLIKILNQTIGYLTPQAKAKLIEITKDKGLVYTTLAMTKMISDIQQDTSLYFMNILEEKTKECL